MCVYTSNMTPATDPLHPSQCTCFNLRKATRVVTQLFDDKLRSSGIRATQFAILSVLSGKQPSAVNELAQALVMDRTTLARNLKPLEKAGLIQSKPGNDRRTRLIELTAHGQATLNRSFSLWEQAQTEVIEKLGLGPWHNLVERLNQAVSKL